MADRPAIPRIVKPRKSVSRYPWIIAIDADSVCVEERGGSFALHPRGELPRIIREHPGGLVAVHGAGRLVKELDRVFDVYPDWQFRLTPIHREIYRPNRDLSKVAIRDTTVGFFGWRSPVSKKAGRYFHPLDPIALYDKSIGQMFEGDEPKWGKLFEWAYDIRDFCAHHGLTPRPTSGGLAAQLLRDSRFYPVPRRKVPASTNARARPVLPGNYYRLLAKPRERVQALYLDMTNAHHSMAERVTFPHADTLRAKGYFRGLPEISETGRPILASSNTYVPRQWARQGSRRYDHILAEHGLFFVSLYVPHLPPTSFPLPIMEGSAGRRYCYVYSNELDYIRSLGCIVEYVIASWSTAEIDYGLNRYATWSKDQVMRADAQRKPWLKPTLLSTYGILAAKPRLVEFGYKRAVGGEDRQYPVGSGHITVRAKVTSTAHEPTTANVIHRGMIEAETRLAALTLARDLRAAGLRILAIYADSVFVASDGTPLPFLPEPWRIQGELTDLEFFTPTAFHSRELEKLPGVPVDDRDRLRRMRQSANLARAGIRSARLPSDGYFELSVPEKDRRQEPWERAKVQSHREGKGSSQNP